MVLVEIRCQRRHVLARIEQTPADWSGTLDIPVCDRCDSRRPGDGRFIPWARGRVRHGETPLTVTFHRIAWADLRPHVEQSWPSGKATDVSVSTLR